MTNGIESYYNIIRMPWGRMSYDLIFNQLNIDDKSNLHVLDFGSGFGILANHYAQKHTVTAIEPNEEMRALRFSENNYTQIAGGFDALNEIDDKFDLVACHNVLEYTENPDEIFAALANTLKIGGRLSIVKHNCLGRAMAAAVFEENPQKALDLIIENKDVEHFFGMRKLYTNECAEKLGKSNGLSLTQIYGIRTFFALTQNNDIKFTDEWYDKMLELEIVASCMDEYIKVAFLNHLIFEKK
ncbi:MAG: class I SAM-dependent methyltransferase [Victivallaceae bacterium]|nr:class I SAM-dependent methyltransferase [Victivallaceae bacterium]